MLHFNSKIAKVLPGVKTLSLSLSLIHKHSHGSKLCPRYHKFCKQRKPMKIAKYKVYSKTILRYRVKYKKAIHRLIPLKSMNTVSRWCYQNITLFVWASWSDLHSNTAPTNGSSFICWLTANVVSVQEISFKNLYFSQISFGSTRDTETKHFKVAKKQK